MTSIPDGALNQVFFPTLNQGQATHGLSGASGLRRLRADVPEFREKPVLGPWARKLIGLMATRCGDLGIQAVAEGGETKAERDTVVDRLRAPAQCRTRGTQSSDPTSQGSGSRT